MPPLRSGSLLKFINVLIVKVNALVLLPCPGQTAGRRLPRIAFRQAQGGGHSVEPQSP